MADTSMKNVRSTGGVQPRGRSSVLMMEAAMPGAAVTRTGAVGVCGASFSAEHQKATLRGGMPIQRVQCFKSDDLNGVYFKIDTESVFFIGNAP